MEIDLITREAIHMTEDNILEVGLLLETCHVGKEEQQPKKKTKACWSEEPFAYVHMCEVICGYICTCVHVYGGLDINVGYLLSIYEDSGPHTYTASVLSPQPWNKES